MPVDGTGVGQLEPETVQDLSPEFIPYLHRKPKVASGVLDRLQGDRLHLDPCTPRDGTGVLK